MFKPSIAKLKGTKDVRKLVKALDHIDNDYREQAVEALIDIGDEAVKPLLDSFIKLSEEEKVRTLEQVILTLIKIGSLHIEPIIELLESDDPTTKDFAFIVLSEIVGERAIDPLINNLNGADEINKLRIIQALTKIGEKSVEPLIKALDNKNSEIKKCVAKALFKIGNEQAIDALKKVGLYDDLKNSTAKKLVLHFQKRDIYFPDRCVFCGSSKEDIITHKVRADIIKDSERVKIHLPYCKNHIREGRKNKRILLGIAVFGGFIPWLLFFLFVLHVKPMIVYTLIILFIIGPLVSMGICSFIKYLLSKKYFSLRNISFDGWYESKADLGIIWEIKGGVVEFRFQNKDIASEFDRNMANI